MKTDFFQFSEENKQKGFTLVEILVAMGLVALFMGGLMAMFVGFTRSYTKENVKADVQQVVRGGVEHMIPYIRLAGFHPLSLAEPPVTITDSTDLGVPGVGFKEATSTKIRFTADLNMDGVIDVAGGSGETNQERITYFLNGSTLFRRLYENTGYQGNDEPIVSNVTSFAFSYLDEDNNLIDSPVPGTNTDRLALIRTVVIKMTVREPAGQEGLITRTYENRVRCRNIKEIE